MTCLQRRGSINGWMQRYSVPPEGAGAGGALGSKYFGFRAGLGVEEVAPVVMPGWLLARGVTSRMPGGTVGGDAGAVFWAVVAGVAAGEVLASLIDELFRP
jgi:hypothetical protein